MQVAKAELVRELLQRVQEVNVVQALVEEENLRAHDLQNMKVAKY